MTAERQPALRYEYGSPPTSSRPAGGSSGQGSGQQGNAPARADSRGTDRIQFLYSALSDFAPIPERREEIQPYFLERFPSMLIKARVLKDQTFYGLTFATHLLPQDFRELIETGQTLTLSLDSSTAIFPWEMAAVSGKRGTLFFGTDLNLTRQFRTLSSPSPGIPPQLNDQLNVLIIADPASRTRSTAGAWQEAVELVRLFAKAQRDSQNRVRIKITVRIGQDREMWEGKPSNPDELNENEPCLQSRLERIAAANPGLTLDKGAGLDKEKQAGTCEPMELLGLLLTEHYDVVHYHRPRRLRFPQRPKRLDVPRRLHPFRDGNPQNPKRPATGLCECLRLGGGRFAIRESAAPGTGVATGAADEPVRLTGRGLLLPGPAELHRAGLGLGGTFHSGKTVCPRFLRRGAGEWRPGRNCHFL